MTFIGLIRGQGSCCEFAVLQNQEGAWSQLSPSQTILLREKPVTLKDIQVEIFCVGLFSVLFLTRRKGHMWLAMLDIAGGWGGWRVVLKWLMGKL